MNLYWLPKGLSPISEALALSACPGGGARSRDHDLEHLKSQRVNHVIGLIEAWELQRLEPPEEMEARRRALSSRGLRFTHEPIEDFEAPTLQQATRLIEQIRADVAQDRRVLVHCMAGLGRAGTIASCALASYGMLAADAIAMVRWVRPGAVQSYAQEQLIDAFERSWRFTHE